MSIPGEQVKQQIDKLRKYLAAQAEQSKNPKGVEFMEGVLDVFDNLNIRLQHIEREVGYNDAFVDPNEGLHRIK